MFANTLLGSNTVRWWSLWVVAAALTYAYSSVLFLALPFVVLLLNDGSKVLLQKDLFHAATITRAAYNLGHTAFNMNEADSGLDYGFNLYRRGDTVDLAKTPQRGQRDKFEECAELLGFQPGKCILDVGCGYGDWLHYCKVLHGARVFGINISDEQVRAARGRDLDVQRCDWKDFAASIDARAYEHTFDYVTFFDTIEHYVPAKYRFERGKQQEIYDAMFQFAHRMLKPGGKVLLSCYHQVRDIDSVKTFLAAWALNNNVEGFYPRGRDGLVDPAKRSGFKEVCRLDKTEDYRLTGVLNAATWQRASGVRFTLAHLRNTLWHVVVDPYFIYRFVTRYFDYWMICYGENAYARSYDPEYREKVTYISLFWILLEVDADP